MTDEQRELNAMVENAVVRLGLQLRRDVEQELKPIREFNERVEHDVYGNGQPGIFRLVLRHDAMLWTLLVLAVTAVGGIFVLLTRG